MRTRRNRRGRRWIALLLAGAALIAVDHRMTPVVSASVAQQAERQAGEVVSEAVRGWLDEAPDPAALLTVTGGSVGAMQSMQADTAQLSRMQTELTLRTSGTFWLYPKNPKRAAEKVPASTRQSTAKPIQARLLAKTRADFCSIICAAKQPRSAPASCSAQISGKL